MLNLQGYLCGICFWMCVLQGADVVNSLMIRRMKDDE